MRSAMEKEEGTRLGVSGGEYRGRDEKEGKAGRKGASLSPSDRPSNAACPAMKPIWKAYRAMLDEGVAAAAAAAAAAIGSDVRW